MLGGTGRTGGRLFATFGAASRIVGSPVLTGAELPQQQRGAPSRWAGGEVEVENFPSQRAAKGRINLCLQLHLRIGLSRRSALLVFRRDHRALFPPALPHTINLEKNCDRANGISVSFGVSFVFVSFHYSNFGRIGSR